MRPFCSSSHRGDFLICMLPLPALLLRVHAGLTVEAAPAFWSSGRRRAPATGCRIEKTREGARSRTGEVGHWPLGHSGRVGESDMVCVRAWSKPRCEPAMAHGCVRERHEMGLTRGIQMYIPPLTTMHTQYISLYWNP